MISERFLQTLVLLVVVGIAKSLCDRSCTLTLEIDPNNPDSELCLLPTEEPLGADSVRHRSSSLHCALEVAANFEGTVCIYLCPGVHNLPVDTNRSSDSLTASNTTVVIKAVNSASVDVVCIDGEELPDSNYDVFPMVFGANTNVEICGVNFMNCARPLLFYAAESVTIDNCSFR